MPRQHLDTKLLGEISRTGGFTLSDRYVGPYSPEDRWWLGTVAREIIYRHLPNGGKRGHDWGSSARFYICNRAGLECESTYETLQDHGAGFSLAAQAWDAAVMALAMEREWQS